MVIFSFIIRAYYYLVKINLTKTKFNLMLKLDPILSLCPKSSSESLHANFIEMDADHSQSSP